MARLARLTLVTAAALALASCEASDSDLVGTWVPDNWSRDRLAEVHGKPVSSRLAVFENGTFAAVEIPLEVGPAGSMPMDEVLITCRGHWTVYRVRGPGNPNLDLQAESCEPGQHAPPPFGNSLVVQTGFLGGHTLVHYRGDPDTGDAIYFERAPAD